MVVSSQQSTGRFSASSARSRALTWRSRSDGRRDEGAGNASARARVRREPS